MDSNLVSRRSALAAASSLALAAGTGLRSLKAAEPGKLIDVHHHYFAPGWMAKFKQEITESNGARFFSWTVQTALDEMDKTGCSTAIVTCGGPGTWNGDVEASRAASRDVNEFGARMVKDHPGRFGFFASIPLPDTEGSMKEIEYSLDTLKADGILLWSNFGDHYLGYPGYAPVLKELNRRKTVVYVHPKLTSDLNDAQDPLRALGINWGKHNPNDEQHAEFRDTNAVAGREIYLFARSWVASDGRTEAGRQFARKARGTAAALYGYRADHYESRRVGRAQCVRRAVTHSLRIGLPVRRRRPKAGIEQGHAESDRCGGNRPRLCAEINPAA